LVAKENAAMKDAPARASARTAQETQKKVESISAGDFTGLDDAHPRLQHMLAYVDHPGIAEVKAAISDIAKTNPDLGATAVQLMTPGAKKTNFYPLQKELQRRFATKQPTAEELAKIPGAPKAPEVSQGALSESPGAGALTVEDELRKIAYQGGKQNRQNYAKEVFEAAPTESTRTAVAKLSTLKTPEAREALFNSIHASATDAEKKFMDQKVKHMIHYRKPE
jgi:hypothetical protein